MTEEIHLVDQTPEESAREALLMKMIRDAYNVHYIAPRLAARLQRPQPIVSPRTVTKKSVRAGTVVREEATLEESEEGIDYGLALADLGLRALDAEARAEKAERLAERAIEEAQLCRAELLRALTYHAWDERGWDNN